MKKFYTLFAAAIIAAGANAQSIYFCGEGEGLGWDPANAYSVDLVDDAYTVEFTSLKKFKVSNASGSWDEFNGGAKTFTFDAETLGEAWELTAGDKDNVVAPGDYKIVINADFTTITMTATGEIGEIDKSLYLRGGMNEWGATDAWKFTTTDGVNYWFNCEGETVIPAATEFKIADSSWGAMDYGFDDEVLEPSEDAAPWFYNGGNASMEEEYTGTIHVVIDPETMEEFVLVTFYPEIVEWETEAPAVDLFLRGGMNEWGAVDAWKFSTTDNVNFWFNCEGETVIPANTEFKIADSSWNTYNYGLNGEATPSTEGVNWAYNSQNTKVTAEYTGTIHVVIEEETAAQYAVVTMYPEIVEWESGISNVAVDNNAPAEYFNLQGVRVANPENGLYIVRRGNNVSKVLVK